MTQANALDILKMGHNVFLTGSAGAGKTFVLNAYIKYLHEHDVTVAITASTGIAATHMQGTTIHAWSGIGIRDSLTDWDIDQMEEKKYLWDHYDKVRVLIIDEVSMLSGDFLDMLDRVCKSFKRNEKPFGGIQIVLCGDLFQLPPIGKGDSGSNMVVDSNAWRTMGLVVCYLTEQHRQDDREFLDILNAIRANGITPGHINTLEGRIREYDAESFQSITKLFTHNADVDQINESELASIDDAEEVYKMTGKGKDKLLESLKKSCLAPTNLRLKINTQVMFVKNNWDKGYVNGTRGTVIDFDNGPGNYPIVKTLEGRKIIVEPVEWAIEDNGKILASISQVPLRHAWAITVHKSQGMSLDAAVIDLSKTFAYGMGYVALSRVRRLDGVHLVGFVEESLLVDPKILLVDKNLQARSEAAETRLAEISVDEIKKSHDDFIIRTGGTLKAVKLTDKKFKEKLKQGRQPTHEITYELIKGGKTVDEVARDRDMTFETVLSHLEKAQKLGLPISFAHIRPGDEDVEIIREAFQMMMDKPKTESGEQKIAPVKGYLDRAGFDYDYGMIRLARLFL